MSCYLFLFCALIAQSLFSPVILQLTLLLYDALACASLVRGL